jgi:EAL domain-containing protein (putative c-di-GMP-specific phosphodiesterase class I)
LRWNPADGRSVPPARFIPIAEDAGMIIAIGEWVLRTACRQVKAWIDAGVPPLRVAVNVSARQLRKQDFPDIVASALIESGLPAQLLEIEITESAVMEEPEEARLILDKLKAMGITLAIDDFGTGYSSLAYLKLFPIDNLKIDRSFVTDIGRHTDDAAIAISTIALAHSLGINVIAEGVETEAQHDLLRAHHCNEFQGFLFSRPLAAADALAFLQSSAANHPGKSA